MSDQLTGCADDQTFATVRTDVLRKTAQGMGLELTPELLEYDLLVRMCARLAVALTTIRDFPIPEQDNVVAANMRIIASRALAGKGPSA